MPHSLPLIILILELTLFNSIPFLMRHYFAIAIVHIVYMLFNLTVTVLSNQPVY